MTIRRLLGNVRAPAIATELQSYGLDVILDDPLHIGEVQVAAVQAFIDRHRVVDGTVIVRTDPGALLDRLFDPAAAVDDSNAIMATGWYFQRGEAVTVESAAGRLADRLRAGQAVTLTRVTAPLLIRALTLRDPMRLTKAQRRVLHALAWFVAASGCPVLLAIRPPDGLRTTFGWRSARHVFRPFARERVRWWPRG